MTWQEFVAVLIGLLVLLACVFWLWIRAPIDEDWP